MLDEMRTFVVLAESGSLQQAAERYSGHHSRRLATRCVM
jgi:hypothetical protein